MNKTTIRTTTLSLALLASIAAVGCVANAGDSADDSASAPSSEEKVGSAVEALGAGPYMIRNVNSQQTLNVPGSLTDDGTQLIQWPAESGVNSQFTLSPTGDGYYNIKVPFDNKCLALVGMNTVPGGSIVQWACGGPIDGTQKFTLQSVGVGVFQIMPLASGMCVEVFEDSTAGGYGIVQAPCAGKASQQWTFQGV